LKKNMDDVPDELLVEKARGGETASFEELVRRHQQRIYRLVYGMTRSHSDADDLAQEVFLTVFRSLGKFKRESSFYTWVYRIAVNRSLNFLKKKSRERQRAEFSENLVPLDGGVQTGPSPEDESMGRELRGRLEDAIQSLPPGFRVTFLLVTDRGMSHAEASRILGCTENTVSWRMHKARGLLRDRLRPFLERGLS
jgi:RNA polymerase sigma-70 factor (ECF subfamily)